MSTSGKGRTSPSPKHQHHHQQRDISPNKASLKSLDNTNEVREKLKQLNDEINRVKAERMRLSPLNKYKYKRNNREQEKEKVKQPKSCNSKSTSKPRKKTPLKTSQSAEGIPTTMNENGQFDEELESLDPIMKTKRKFHHPQLEFVVADCANSPYLTSPEKTYSANTINCANKLRYLRFMGKKPHELEEDEIPVDLEKAKEIFLKEIIEFKARFEYHEREKNLPLQYFEKDDMKIPDVTSRPRETSMVFPNKYKPLEGHTGKLKHVESFLYVDTDRPWTSADALASKLSEAEYFQYLKELQEAAKPRSQLSKNRRHTSLERQLSGVLKAHMSRGGPSQYKKKLKLKKAYKHAANHKKQQGGSDPVQEAQAGHHDDYADTFPDDGKYADDNDGGHEETKGSKDEDGDGDTEAHEYEDEEFDNSYEDDKKAAEKVEPKTSPKGELSQDHTQGVDYASDFESLSMENISKSIVEESERRKSQDSNRENVSSRSRANSRASSPEKNSKKKKVTIDTTNSSEQFNDSGENSRASSSPQRKRVVIVKDSELVNDGSADREAMSNAASKSRDVSPTNTQASTHNYALELQKLVMPPVSPTPPITKVKSYNLVETNDTSSRVQLNGTKSSSNGEISAPEIVLAKKEANLSHPQLNSTDSKKSIDEEAEDAIEYSAPEIVLPTKEDSLSHPQLNPTDSKKSIDDEEDDAIEYSAVSMVAETAEVTVSDIIEQARRSPSLSRPSTAPEPPQQPPQAQEKSKSFGETNILVIEEPDDTSVADDYHDEEQKVELEPILAAKTVEPTVVEVSPSVDHKDPPRDHDHHDEQVFHSIAEDNVQDYIKRAISSPNLYQNHVPDEESKDEPTAAVIETGRRTHQSEDDFDYLNVDEVRKQYEDEDDVIEMSTNSAPLSYQSIREGGVEAFQSIVEEIDEAEYLLHDNHSPLFTPPHTAHGPPPLITMETPLEGLREEEEVPENEWEDDDSTCIRAERENFHRQVVENVSSHSSVAKAKGNKGEGGGEEGAGGGEEDDYIYDDDDDFESLTSQKIHENIKNTSDPTDPLHDENSLSMEDAGEDGEEGLLPPSHFSTMDLADEPVVPVNHDEWEV